MSIAYLIVVTSTGNRNDYFRCYAESSSDSREYNRRCRDYSSSSSSSESNCGFNTLVCRDFRCKPTKATKCFTATECVPAKPAKTLDTEIYHIEGIIESAVRNIDPVLNRAAIAFKNAVIECIERTDRNLLEKIATALSNLKTKISSIINTGEATELTNVLANINQTNNALLNGVESLLATAAQSTTTTITILAGDTQPNIIASVTNLSTGGLLFTILGFINTASTGANTLFTTTTNEQITAITGIMSNSTTALIADVATEIDNTGKILKSLVAAAAGQQIRCISEYLCQFINDIKINMDCLIRDIGREIICCIKKRCGIPGYEYKNSFRPPVFYGKMNSPRYGGVCNRPYLGLREDLDLGFD
ncbi:hypothetical protein CWI38_0386p0010 [Hamiltosporidium tvaerminnensis]|nr:hypothetical protein CWI39_1269p0010 [Hamiltosporidium magnivora]TBU13586.1 hypothetical protein CWI38_0386p0010 [Hamiltosporidium tvaerminnensis]